jgi:hypothetical protein
LLREELLPFSHSRKSLAYILVVVVGVILSAACSPTGAGLPETVTESNTPLSALEPPVNVPATQLTAEETTAPATIEPEPAGSAIPVETENILLFDGIPQGQTIDGFPYLGSPDAPVTLVDYSDFL